MFIILYIYIYTYNIIYIIIVYYILACSACWPLSRVVLVSFPPSLSATTRDRPDKLSPPSLKSASDRKAEGGHGYEGMSKRVGGAAD